ncbi:MAG: polysaccharide deacetylase family protein [Alphaproteobacteria bacterium]|nr:polysaccharide deacetylase family protein [Alphaproteobacteria bacterium]
MLKIYCNQSYIKEKLYVFRIIFEEWLGIPYEIFEHEGQEVRIIVNDEEGRQWELIVNETLFSTPLHEWLTEKSLPQQPLKRVFLDQKGIKPKLVQHEIPVIYGDSGITNDSLITYDGSRIHLGIDIFGSIFFMITRYEEYVKTALDTHQRFSAYDSMAFQEDFLMRPIVNEYLEILWGCLKFLSPDLLRKKRTYSVFLTHDVDQPLYNLGISFRRIFKSLAADILLRKDVALFLRRFFSILKGWMGNYKSDPYNTFDYLMNMSEAFSLKSYFFFIAGHTDADLDGHYTLDMPWIKKLMKSIHERGHQIGLHPSYNTYLSPESLNREFQNLLRVADLENIKQETWGGRQHYLRWSAFKTWQCWEQVGLNFDSTVCFADHVGFRCGTCYEFPVFNLRTSQELSLVERPLIVMDGTLRGPLYQNLSKKEALNTIKNLSDAVKKYDGMFTLLWHNDFIPGKQDKQFYKHVLSTLTSKVSLQ